ncbi:unnamed protein product [Lampetra fluviatilis]
MDTSSSFTRKMNSWATLPAVMAGTVVGVMALQFIFTFTTECPCYYSDAFSDISFTGPPVLLSLWSGKFLQRMRRSSTVEEKEFNLRGASVLMVAGFTWSVVALLNGELLCCMMKDDEACLDPDTFGVILMVIATIIIFLMLNVCCDCCCACCCGCCCAAGQSRDQVEEGMPRFPNTNWASHVNIAFQFD